MVLKDPPKILDAAVDWTAFLSDVDGNGTPFARFVEQVVKALLMSARAVLYLNARAVAGDERPRVVWSLRRAEDLVSWKTTPAGALERARLRETRIVSRKENPDQLEKVDYFRTVEQLEDRSIIVRQSQALAEDAEQEAGDVLQRAGRFGQLETFPILVGDIPTDDSSPDLRPPKPPMLDLAELALSHYQTAQDLEQSLHWVGSPQPYVETSRPIPNLLVGPSRLLRVPPGAKLGMLESTGGGPAAQEKALERKSRQMAAIGGRLIDEAVTRHAETATAMKLKSGGDRSILGTIAGTAEAITRRALALTAQWEGYAGEPGRVELTRDYIDTKLTADEVRELIALRNADEISQEDLRHALVTGQFLRPAKQEDGNEGDGDE